MLLGLFFKSFLSVFQEGKQWQDGTFNGSIHFTSIFIPCFSFSAQEHIVLVSCGYHNKLPQNPWFKEQKFILSLSGGQKSGVKVAAGLNSLWRFWGAGCFLPLPAAGGPGYLLACGWSSPISASIFMLLSSPCPKSPSPFSSKDTSHWLEGPASSTLIPFWHP